jgi:dTMP kinase
LQGLFITFEGLDGSGKSTQLRMLASELRLRGMEVTSTREPGGTMLGRKLREVFLESDDVIDPLAELLLFAADRAQHVRKLIRPALEKGQIVFSDRFADSTIAYQGAGRGFPEKLIKQIVKIATDGLKPDLTIFFDLPLVEAATRKLNQNDDGSDKNRMDKEDTDFYRRVRDCYLELVKAEPKRFCIVDATGTVNEVHNRVKEIVEPYLEKLNG